MTITKVKFRLIDSLTRNPLVRYYVETQIARRMLDSLRMEAAAPGGILETSAMALHQARHPAGYGSVCGDCRTLAQIVKKVLDRQRFHDAEAGWFAAREYYGSADGDGVIHGAECNAHKGYVCTCNPTAQRAAFDDWVNDGLD